MSLEGNLASLSLLLERLGRVVLGGLLGVHLTGAAVLVATDLLHHKLWLLLQQRLRGDLLLGGGALDLGPQVTGGTVADQFLGSNWERRLFHLFAGRWGSSRGFCSLRWSLHDKLFKKFSQKTKR